MSKVGIVQRDLKRRTIVNRYSKKRILLKSIISKSSNANKNDKWSAYLKLQKLPLNSSPTRLRNRCAITGRPRGVYRKFGLCRNQLREHAMMGNVPGLMKASW